MLYGFVVAAWLVVYGQAPLPFATMADCQVAQKALRDAYIMNDKAINCIPTGVGR